MCISFASAPAKGPKTGRTSIFSIYESVFDDVKKSAIQILSKVDEQPKWTKYTAQLDLQNANS